MILKFLFIYGIELHISSLFNKKFFNFLNFSKFKNYSNNRFSNTCISLPGIITTMNLFFLKKIILFGFFLKNYLFYMSLFIRKSYFYPDLPKNYQLTQLKSIFNNGVLIIYNNFISNPYYKFIIITKIHMEEDAGSIYYNIKNKNSILNFNRSNNYLIEVVSYYNLNNFYEIFLYLNNFKFFIFFNKKKIIYKFFRFDINISIKYLFQNITLFKIEIKNLDSFFILKNIINFEIKRQIYIFFIKKYKNETRFYDLNNDNTYFARNKESLFDYKYITDLDQKKLHIKYYFNFLIKYKIILNYYYRLFFFYNFKIILNYNFFLFFFLIFLFGNKKKLFFLLKKNKYIFYLRVLHISIFQMTVLIKLFLNNILNFSNFKRILFFFYIKRTNSNIFIYKLILKNNYIFKKKCNYFENYLILSSFKPIHSFNFNKKIFDFFMKYFKILNYDYFYFFNYLNSKLNTL